MHFEVMHKCVRPDVGPRAQHCGRAVCCESAASAVRTGRLEKAYLPGEQLTDHDAFRLAWCGLVSSPCHCAVLIDVFGSRQQKLQEAGVSIS
jgi:hypothetical protein